MSRNLRMILIFTGLAILLCSLAALAYAFWPVEVLSTQATLAPTLLTPP